MAPAPSRAPRPTGPSPSRAVAREFARALVDLVLGAPRLGLYLLRRRRLAAELAADLARPAKVEDRELPAALPTDRPLVVFVSAAEPSGETHALNLVRALRAELAAAGAPPPRLLGLGGPALADQGVEIVGNPVARAAMGADVLRALPFYLRLLRDAAAALRSGADLFLPVDSPALHVPLAHMARRYGVPVAHFVTPQYWAWAPWRVRGYARAVDLALSILPFEPSWFRRHGVRVVHAGHPQLDRLADVPTSPEPADAPRLVILPGSRGSVIERNLPWMLARARRLAECVPGLEVVIPHDREDQRGRLEALLAREAAGLDVRLVFGDLHGELARARAALSVSGTVLLDLLHHRLPAVVVYRLGSPFLARLSRHLLTVPWFSSVNLLAGREVLPEHCFAGEGPTLEIIVSRMRYMASQTKIILRIVALSASKP